MTVRLHPAHAAVVAATLLLGPVACGRAPTQAPAPGRSSAEWQTAHFRDATRRVRLTVRAATGDTTERATGDRIEAERVDAAGAGTLLLTVHSSPPYLSDDSLVVSARTLAPRAERLRVRAGRAPGAGSTTVTIQYAGRRVTGTVQRGDSAPVSSDSTYAEAPFAFNEMEALLRSVPLRTGYQVVVPLFSELDRAVEHDTITVLGPAPADNAAGGPARGPAWRVRFADPVIVMTARVDAARGHWPTARSCSAGAGPASATCRTGPRRKMRPAVPRVPHTPRGRRHASSPP